jgi:hypothetical protein
MDRLFARLLFLGVALSFLDAGGARAQVVTGPAIPIPPGRAARPPYAGPRVFVVDDTPECRFSGAIQAAVDAAADGDIVLVMPGIHAGFRIAGKSVHVFGDSSAGEVRVTSKLEVRDLSADQVAVVRGLAFVGSFQEGLVENNDGAIWIEDCSFQFGLRVSASDAVGVFDCESLGHSSFTLVSRGLRATDGAEVFAYGSSFLGFDGRDAFCYDCYCYYGCYGYYGTDATSGGAAVTLSTGARASFFGNHLEGGAGGAGYDCSALGAVCDFPAAGDGHALFGEPGTEARLMNNTIVGRLGGGGTRTHLPGRVGSYSVASPVSSGTPATLEFSGPPGWDVFLTYSVAYAPEYVPERNGFSVVDPESPLLFIGSLPLSGTLQIAVPFQLPLGAKAGVFYSQMKLYDPATDSAYLAEPSALLVVKDPCP